MWMRDVPPQKSRQLFNRLSVCRGEAFCTCFVTGSRMSGGIGNSSPALDLSIAIAGSNVIRWTSCAHVICSLFSLDAMEFSASNSASAAMAIISFAFAIGYRPKTPQTKRFHHAKRNLYPAYTNQPDFLQSIQKAVFPICWTKDRAHCIIKDVQQSCWFCWMITSTTIAVIPVYLVHSKWAGVAFCKYNLIFFLSLIIKISLAPRSSSVFEMSVFLLHMLMAWSG